MTESVPDTSMNKFRVLVSSFLPLIGSFGDLSHPDLINCGMDNRTDPVESVAIDTILTLISAVAILLFIFLKLPARHLWQNWTFTRKTFEIFECFSLLVAYLYWCHRRNIEVNPFIFRK